MRVLSPLKLRPKLWTLKTLPGTSIVTESRSSKKEDAIAVMNWIVVGRTKLTILATVDVRTMTSVSYQTERPRGRFDQSYSTMREAARRAGPSATALSYNYL